MSLRKGLVIFILQTFGASAVVLFTSVDQETWSTLLGADKRLLFAALLLVFCAWACDAGRFRALTHAAGENIGFRMGMILTWLHYFGCAVTPMQSGGGPFQVYVLYKKNVPIGKGIAITLTRTLLTVVLLSIAVPVAVLIEPDIIGDKVFLRGAFLYVMAFILVSCALVVLSAVRPDIIKKWASVLMIRLKRFRIGRGIQLIASIKRVHLEVDNYNLNLRMFMTCGRKHFLLAVVLSALHLLCIFSVLPCLIASVRLPFDYQQAIVAQAVFMFILYFVPTPGASGVAEGGGAAIFSLLVPWNMAGVMAIAWRFFTEYLSIAMGIVVAVRIIGWGVTESIHKDSSSKEMEHLKKDDDDDHE